MWSSCDEKDFPPLQDKQSILIRFAAEENTQTHIPYSLSCCYDRMERMTLNQKVCGFCGGFGLIEFKKSFFSVVDH